MTDVNPIPQMLIDAAAHGVNVTVITNTPSDFEPTYPWKFRDHRDGETARYSRFEFYAFVQDMDGDASWWVVREYGCEVATGEIWEGDHYSLALAAAEEWLNKLNAPRDLWS